MGRRWWLAGALLLLAGCPEADIRPLDAGGLVDAAGMDAGRADASDGRDATTDPGDAGDVPDAGDAPDAGGADAAVIEANVVFVTSTPVTPGAIGGRAAADALCNDLAMAARLPRVGSYVAWLSVAGEGAIARLRTSRGWVRPDGEPFADTPDDLTEGRVLASPSLDERGEDAGDYVVTGTSVTGVALGGTCADWASTDGDVRLGASTDGTRGWTSSLDRPCGDSAYLYCFGTGQNVAVGPGTHTGRLAFLSTDRLGGAIGLGALDAACVRDAELAGHGTRDMVAFLATSTETAADRLTDGAPWVRPDGIVVARSRDELARRVLAAPITTSADLSSYDDPLVWVGAGAPDRLSARGEDCGGWANPAATGRRGEAGSALSFFDGSNVDCSLPHRVMCFER